MNFQSERRALPRAYMPTVYNNQLEREKQKSRLIKSNYQKIMSFVLETSFLAVPMLTGWKTVQKGGFGPKRGFSIKIGWRQRVNFLSQPEKPEKPIEKKMKRFISKLKLDTYHCKTGNRNGNILS